MFGRKKTEEIRAFLGKGVIFRGSLAFAGFIRIDGDLYGDISGDGVVVIGNGAHIEASIIAQSVIIGGNVIGNIDAREKVVIEATGRLFGDVHSSMFAVEEGAFFEGFSKMRGQGEGAGGKDEGLQKSNGLPERHQR